MNGIQNRKAQNIEKVFPGCLGRMVNFFDLSNGANGNRLLSDKPHTDASLSRSRSDVTKMRTAPFGDQIEDKMIIPELRKSSSNKKSTGTPMKALIAQEMSKEVESRNSPPNLVAKLMGLDALPHQQHNSGAQRSRSKGYSRRSLSHSGVLRECWEQDHNFLDKQGHCEGRHLQGQIEYKDIYEIWQQSQRINGRYSSPQKGRQSDDANEKKMAIIRQKFKELKCLATDEKGLQSQEFQEALEVINSNRDLFAKFLEEPNSMFSQCLYDKHSVPASPDTKRITVLRPSRLGDDESLCVLGKKVDKQTKKPVQIDLANMWDKTGISHSPIYASQGLDECPGQPTRIVVLKPSPANTFDMKAVNSPASSSPRILRSEEFFEEPDNDEAQESREVAKEITRQMRENLMGHRRDETLMSSVFSNGYIGDDSSFNKSYNEYGLENLSDSEIMSPTSKHSWDYINRFGSPYSCSSFSRASCSPESSVCREAKKRLSERWAMMSLNGSSQEQKTARRSSSTLGEMLALSDTKKLTINEIESIKEEQESRGSTSCLASNLTNKGDGLVDFPKSLLRSKSLPVSSTVYVSGFNAVASDQASKPEVSKELTKSKSTKSSLKGKVSSLFFSRNKKPNKDKLGASQATDRSHSVTHETPGSPALLGKNSDATSQRISNNEFEGCSSLSSHGSVGKINYPDTSWSGVEQGIGSQEGGLSVSKPMIPGSGNAGENQDQPSPISVLEPLFEEDDINSREPSGNRKLDRWGADMSIKSNLIDKSPPIGSIARTLSWDDSRAGTAISYSVKPSHISVAPEEEEQDWFLFVQTLLLTAGLDGKMQVEADTFCDSWHSPESPLDPALRGKFMNVDTKELLHEAKQRQRRSSQKLVFDSVNVALWELGRGNGSDSFTGMVVPCGRTSKKLIEGASATLVDHVWDQMKEWFCSEVRCTFGECGDGNGLVVERVVRKEVVGTGWVDNMRVEVDNVGMEIEGKLLEQLVEEAVVELTYRV